MSHTLEYFDSGDQQISPDFQWKKKYILNKLLFDGSTLFNQY